MREVTRTLETRDELWDSPLLYMTDRAQPDRRMGAAEDVPDGLRPGTIEDDVSRPRAFGITTVTIATDLPELGTLRDEQRLLRAQLARLRRRLRLQLALELAVDAAVVLTATAAVLVSLDWWSRFGLSARLALLTASLAAILVFLAVRTVRRRRSWRLDELSLAMILDRFRPGTGQQVADVLQLPDLLDDPTASSSSSPAMVRLAVRRASQALAGSDWGSLWNTRRTAAHGGALLVALLDPGGVRARWRRTRPG